MQWQLGHGLSVQRRYGDPRLEVSVLIYCPIFAILLNSSRLLP